MTIIHGFKLTREQYIPEIKTRAFLYEHVKTGVELLSMSNEDENKVFGISFSTPPPDSTGLPHILEHSVLCGSRKYPVKEPFVELLKGSLKTFLNAMTYPDKTCYPVASQNLQDFYNLIDVYLDAVFYPRLTPFVFQQEGWHYELEAQDAPLRYKGVVYNEMKGAYSSPDNLISEYSFRSIFPDNAYGFDSGGDPKHIPNLTFEQFIDFHKRYYHPSNARVYFYGDDDPERRLFLMDKYLRDFERMEIDSMVRLQRPFKEPRRIIRSFAAGADEGAGLKGMITLNWLLPQGADSGLNLAMHFLEYILLGMPGSPLRKALIESRLGEGLVGIGLGSETRQLYFSTGLKGIDLDNADRIQDLIIRTLTGLADKGIDLNDIEAAVNSIEFSLRENNTGGLPRGLSLMLRAFTTWLYNDDPLALIAFETPLKAVKSAIGANKRFFEDMIRRYFLDNSHRTSLILRPDPDMDRKEREAEEKRLGRAKEDMARDDIEAVISNMKRLKEIQETPDSPEALATIPMLRPSDLDRMNKIIPLESGKGAGTSILYHDLFTNGIAYLDLGFNLHGLAQRYLPYCRLFGRSLIEMGTETDDYVTVSQRISRKTGGIWPVIHTSDVKGQETGALWLFLRGKAMSLQTEDLIEILRDIILTVRLDNRERFRQIVLEAKAREEQRLVPSGHQVINLRIRSHFSEAGWAAEQISGLSYLFFLRKLSRAVDEDWPAVLGDLREMHRIIVNRNGMLVNATIDEKGWSLFRPQVVSFLDRLPMSEADSAEWSPEDRPGFEAMTMPAQVNYVGKGANLYRLGYRFHGSAHVICRFLRNSWLWDRVRVQGGAYGAFCLFDRLSGTVTFVSYRDPNILKTIDVFDQSAEFLKGLELGRDELTKGIIGSIGDMDAYQLPDARGFTSMARVIAGETDDDLQRIREEILGTKAEDFRAFADVLDYVRNNGLIKVLGSQEAIQEVVNTRPGWMEIVKVL
jgi:Zn-dependent M16 (insulinase) family peptidase